MENNSSQTQSFITPVITPVEPVISSELTDNSTSIATTSTSNTTNILHIGLIVVIALHFVTVIILLFDLFGSKIAMIIIFILSLIIFVLTFVIAICSMLLECIKI